MQLQLNSRPITSKVALLIHSDTTFSSSASDGHFGSDLLRIKEGLSCPLGVKFTKTLPKSSIVEEFGKAASIDLLRCLMDSGVPLWWLMGTAFASGKMHIASAFDILPSANLCHEWIVT